MSAESRRVSASGKGLFDLWTQVLHRQHSKWHTTISVQHVCGRTCKSHTERLRTSKPSIFLLRGKSTKCYTTMLPRIRLSRLNTELLFQRSFLLLSVGGVIEMIKEQQRGKAQLTSDFQITPHLSCCAQSSVLLCTRAMLHFWIHNLYKMTKSGTFRLSDRHTHTHIIWRKNMLSLSGLSSKCHSQWIHFLISSGRKETDENKASLIKGFCKYWC